MDLFEEPQWGLKRGYYGAFASCILFEEPQWGLKPAVELKAFAEIEIRRTPMGIETGAKAFVRIRVCEFEEPQWGLKPSDAVFVRIFD